MTHRRGFTLIELVIVIAIIGILSSLAIPKFLDMSQEAKIATAKSGLGTIRAVLMTKYAASATGGQTASYPNFLAPTDFAGRGLPKNPLHSNYLNAVTAVTEVAATVPGTQNNSGIGFWYVTNPAAGVPAGSDYGKAGAYSNNDGSIDTSSW